MSTKSAKHREGRNIAGLVTLNALQKIRPHTSDKPFITVKAMPFQQMVETDGVLKPPALLVTTKSHAQQIIIFRGRIPLAVCWGSLT